MWTIALYELKQLVRTKSVLALLILAPLLLIFILGTALSNVFQPGDRTIDPVTVAYVDADQGQLSASFESFLETMKTEGHLEMLPVSSRNELLQRLKLKEAQLGVSIPKGFSDAVLSGQEAEWELIPGSDPIKSKIGIMMVRTFLEETNRMQAAAMVLGPSSMAGMADSGETKKTASFVEAGKMGKAGTEYSALQYYSSSMLVMFLLYSGLTAAISLLREKETHTLTRLQTTPVSPFSILVGKLLGNSLMAVLQAAAIIAVTIFAYGASWGSNLVYVFLICLLTILASMGMAFVVAFLFKSTKAVGGAFAAFIGFMTFASGGMMPTEGTFLGTLSPFTVNYWASNSFIRLMTGQELSGVIGNLSVLGLIGCAFLLIAFVLYRKVGYHE